MRIPQALSDATAASPTAAPAAAELQSKGELTEADVANLKAEAQQEVKKDR